MIRTFYPDSLKLIGSLHDNMQEISVRQYSIAMIEYLVCSHNVCMAHNPHMCITLSLCGHNLSMCITLCGTQSTICVSHFLCMVLYTTPICAPHFLCVVHNPHMNIKLCMLHNPHLGITLCLYGTQPPFVQHTLFGTQSHGQCAVIFSSNWITRMPGKFLQ